MAIYRHLDDMEDLQSEMLETNINWLVSALRLELAENPSREKK
jgi:hypothetical protein